MKLHTKSATSIVLFVIILISSVFFIVQALSLQKVINKPTLLLFIAYSIAIVVISFIFHLLLRKKNATINSLHEQNDRIFQQMEKNTYEDINQQTKEELQRQLEMNRETRINKILHNIPVEQKLQTYAERFLANLSKEFEIVQGLFFVKNFSTQTFTLAGSYAFFTQNKIEDFKLGEGLTGQVAYSKRSLHVSNVPEGYITILSGLGSSSPRNLLIFPIIDNDETIVVVELASFRDFDDDSEQFFAKLAERIAPEILKLIAKN